MNTKLYISPRYDASHNLALEEYIFENLKEGDRFYLFYRNEPAVIVGRNQNTVDEVDESACTRDGVKIVRRMTGGGAVYHDLGNLNFSIMKPGKPGEFSFKEDLEPAIRALGALGVPSALSQRNDILLDGKKISGCAMREGSGKALVHGTLLYDSDLERIEDYLTVSKEKMRGKGVQSVKSRVGRIKDFYEEKEMPLPERDEFFEAFIKALSSGDDVQIWKPSEKDLLEIDKLRREKYETRAWNFGKSPKYNVRIVKKFPAGLLSAFLMVKENRIEEARIFSDGFGDAPMQELEESLEGAQYTSDCVLSRLPESLEDYIKGMDREAFSLWITEGK